MNSKEGCDQFFSVACLVTCDSRPSGAMIRRMSFIYSHHSRAWRNSHFSPLDFNKPFFLTHSAERKFERFEFNLDETALQISVHAKENSFQSSCDSAKALELSAQRNRQCEPHIPRRERFFPKDSPQKVLSSVSKALPLPHDVASCQMIYARLHDSIAD